MPFWGVTMSLHKLTAGSGYDYLTRQVAALDATETGHIGLASSIQRVEAVGGRLTLSPAPGGGTSIAVSLPT